MGSGLMQTDSRMSQEAANHDPEQGRRRGEPAEGSKSAGPVQELRVQQASRGSRPALPTAWRASSETGTSLEEQDGQVMWGCEGFATGQAPPAVH